MPPGRMPPPLIPRRAQDFEVLEPDSRTLENGLNVAPEFPVHRYIQLAPARAEDEVDRFLIPIGDPDNTRSVTLIAPSVLDQADTSARTLIAIRTKMVADALMDVDWTGRSYGANGSWMVSAGALSRQLTRARDYISTRIGEVVPAAHLPLVLNRAMAEKLAEGASVRAMQAQRWAAYAEKVDAIEDDFLKTKVRSPEADEDSSGMPKMIDGHPVVVEATVDASEIAALPDGSAYLIYRPGSVRSPAPETKAAIVLRYRDHAMALVELDGGPTGVLSVFGIEVNNADGLVRFERVVG